MPPVTSTWNQGVRTFSTGPYCQYYLTSVASLASPGIDTLRWLRPVRPGDHLSIRVTVLEARRSRSKPDRGIVTSSVEVLNQDDDAVMTFQAMNMIRCRGEAVPEMRTGC